MKQRLSIPSAGQILAFLKRYKFVLVVMAAGIIVLALPASDKRAAGGGDAESIRGEEEFSIEALEDELSDILSRIDGAGRVSVMLTALSGTERIPAVNWERSEDGEECELREEVVIISTDNGEEAVLIGQNYPVFRGALVVCPGGDDPEVVLMLTKALSALTGLSSSHITVCKGS